MMLPQRIISKTIYLPNLLISLFSLHIGLSSLYTIIQLLTNTLTLIRQPTQ